MGTLFLNQIKKQASFFLQEKYKNARVALTDVSQAELLSEEATNNDPWGPDAKTMTEIAEASYEVDDYFRIVDVLHRRFDSIDWKEWRQSYKSLILLEFLLTHGPEEFAEEFQSDGDIIEELGTFIYIDEKGFNWGANMEKRSDHIITLLDGGVKLKEARLKALKITKEITGFGNVPSSPLSASSSSSSSPFSATSDSSIASSFGSYSSSSSSSSSSSTFNETLIQKEEDSYSQHGLILNVNNKEMTSHAGNKDLEGTHVWNYSPLIQETGSLLDFDYENYNYNKQEEEEEEEEDNSIRSKLLVATGPSRKYINGERELFRSFSDHVGRLMKMKNYHRQFSWGNC